MNREKSIKKYFQLKLEECQFKIGLRTTKTALAVFLCLFVNMIAGTDMGLYSCIAAVVCMKETADQSWQMGFHRFLGTLVGGILGYFMVLLALRLEHYQEWSYVLIIPIGLILCIWVCLIIGTKDGVVICCVVFIGIGLEPELNKFATISNVMLRMVDTTIGIVVAWLVNSFVFPYREEECKKPNL